MMKNILKNTNYEEFDTLGIVLLVYSRFECFLKVNYNFYLFIKI
jgi:hypothetical protein